VTSQRFIAAQRPPANQIPDTDPNPASTHLEVSMTPAAAAPGLWPYLAPVLLLFCSNIFMTLAWYGHLKFKAVPLVTVILVSWAIAFVEYCFAVPGNRIGSAVYSPAELKTIQEVITLVVFAGFTAIYFKEPLSLTQGAGFALIALGAMLVFRGQA
jgi:hypothetical protein